MKKAAYSPQEFCEAHGMSRTAFYQVLKEGRGPTTFKVGRRTFVSEEAAADWRRRMEADNAKEVK